MSKDDAPKGLLAKMVRFVKNPATNWSDLDEGAPGSANSNLSKLQLKEMIERKRRNDFVRKREFDMLRKIRRREVEVGVGNANDIVRPSFFQSSMPSKPDDRANTLKKIDEIEAQMSMQWWKTKHGTVPGDMRSTNFGAAAKDSAAKPGDWPKAPPVAESAISYAPTAPSALDAHIEQTVRSDLEPTQPPDIPSPKAGLSKTPLGANGASSVFTNSKLFAMEVDEVAHDPELEEAAIRFANGDDSGAEAGLLDALGPNGTRATHLETWLALFDLYRATGQADRFETAAIEFVGKFARSAPQWFSMPDIVGKMANPDAAAALAAEGGVRKADWICPSIVGLQTVAALNAALGRATMPWRLNWSNIKSVEANAVEPLTKLLLGFAQQPVQLRFIGEQELLQCAQAATPSGDRGVSQVWWQLRMALLRVMHRPDEFELAALDYCVTYEVSPPSWEDARCQYKALDADGTTVRHTIVGESIQTTLPPLPSNSESPGLGEHRDATTLASAHLSTVELSGQIEGDPAPVLARLEARLAGADILIISCSRLIRVDFSAAGALLNWVSARQNEGRQVSFVEMHRLVAGFFDVIGISDHAKVVCRRD